MGKFQQRLAFPIPLPIWGFSRAYAYAYVHARGVAPGSTFG
jgi:hypothetical protein